MKNIYLAKRKSEIDFEPFDNSEKKLFNYLVEVRKLSISQAYEYIRESREMVKKLAV